MSFNFTSFRNVDSRALRLQTTISSANENVEPSSEIQSRVEGIAQVRLGQFSHEAIQNPPPQVRRFFPSNFQERSSPRDSAPVETNTWSGVIHRLNDVSPAFLRSRYALVHSLRLSERNSELGRPLEVRETYQSSRNTLRHSLGLDQTDLEIPNPSGQISSEQSSGNPMSFSLSFDRIVPSLQSGVEPIERNSDLTRELEESESEQESFYDDSETTSVLRPKKINYSNGVEESRKLRFAVEVSCHNKDGSEPSKYNEVILPTKFELIESQFDYSHIEHRLETDEIPDAPSNIEYRDFDRLLLEYEVTATLPEIIEDEGEEYLREQFLDLFKSHIQGFVDYQPVSHVDLTDRKKAQEKKALKIQKYLKHVIKHFLVEHDKIESLSISEKVAAKEKIKDSLKKHFMNLAHGTLHCSDRIKQESELMYHELCANEMTSSLLIETTEHKIFKHIGKFRNEVFKETVAHYARKFPSGRGVDLASSIEYYQNKFGEDLNLRDSDGTEFSSYVNRNLSKKIRKKFYQSYTPKAMVEYLKDNAKYSDFYKWFVDRYDVPGLGFKISNEECDNLNDEAVVYLLQKIKVVD